VIDVGQGHCVSALAKRERTRSKNKGEGNAAAAFYVFAIAAIILHYTGHLRRWNCEWVLIVLAIAVFPAVLFL
jgi:Ca2+/Na+ antiporter